MRHTAVDDVHGVHARLGGIQRTADLGQHAARDGAVGKQPVDLTCGQIGQQVAALVQHTGGVGQQHQLFGLQHRRQLAGHHVGIDVVALVLFAKADGADHGNEGIVL